METRKRDPRVVVSAARHDKLAAEAKKKKISIAELAEQKFKKAR
jgi:predicted HicB family RNase H-like nuclease